MPVNGTVLGFDFGASRIGVAVGNTVTMSANALCIINSRTNDSKWESVRKLVAEWQPAAFVVGLPLDQDGTPRKTSGLALKFARQLEGRYPSIPVNMVDERYSSSVVKDTGSEYIDDDAAAVILQQWFDEGCPERPPFSLKENNN